jgi:hypothetical protein
LYLAASAISFAAAAHTIEGRAVRVSDGDTVTLLDGLHAQYRIRLAGKMRRRVRCFVNALRLRLRLV